MRIVAVVCVLCVCASVAEAQLVVPGISGGAAGGAGVTPVEPTLTFTAPAPGDVQSPNSSQTMGGSYTAGTTTVDHVSVKCVKLSDGTQTVAETNATLNAPTLTWSVTLSLSVNTHVCTARLYDNAAAVRVAVPKTFDIISPDQVRPDCTVDAGAATSVNGTSSTASLHCTDDIDTTSVTVGRTPAGGASSCTRNGPSGLTTTWTCTLDLASTDNRNTVNAFTFTGTDASGQDVTPAALNVTRLVTLQITTSTLACGIANQAYPATQLFAAIGGTGSGQTWDNQAGGTSLGAGACTGLQVSNAGVVSGTPTTTGTCSAPVRVTDSGAFTASATVTIPVDATCSATTNSYYDTLRAYSTWGGRTHAWSLRSQASINSVDNLNSGDNGSFHYRYPGGGSDNVAPSPGGAANCFGSNCDDTSADKKDAALLTFPPVECVPNSINPKNITSTTAATPSLFTWDTGGITDTHVTNHQIFQAIIRSHPDATINNDATTYVRIQSRTATGTTGVYTVTADLVNVDGTARTTSSCSGAGTCGTIEILVCNCTATGQTSCSPVERFAVADQLHPLLDMTNSERKQLFVAFDYWLKPSWAHSTSHKMWAFLQNTAQNDGGAAAMFFQWATGAYGSDTLKLEGGNGSGPTSAGAFHHELANVKIAAPGMIEFEPWYPAGQGTAVDSGRAPVNNRVHMQLGKWTREMILIETRVPFSDATFATWRSTAGQGNGLATIDTCTDSAGVTTCTLVTPGSAWRFNKLPGDTRPIRISGAAGGQALLNGDHDATILSASQFRFPTPNGFTTGSGGSVEMYFQAVWWWMSDESRDPIRLLFAAPWEIYNPFLNAFAMNWNTSTNAKVRQETVEMYIKNLVMVQPGLNGAPAFNLSGVCNNNTYDGVTLGDRGYCTVDAGNNQTYLKKPVP